MLNSIAQIFNRMNALRVVRAFKTIGKRLQQTFRQMIGIPDYENYVQQHAKRGHPKACMSYEEFFRERQLNRYEGKTPGSRCC